MNDAVKKRPALYGHHIGRRMLKLFRCIAVEKLL
jgi:hypothetical protein